jgi:hypothetical protein
LNPPSLTLEWTCKKKIKKINATLLPLSAFYIFLSNIYSAIYIYIFDTIYEVLYGISITCRASVSKHCFTFSLVLALDSKKEHWSPFASVIPSSRLTVLSESWNHKSILSQEFICEREK